jgi:primosomal protein N' (replication factor Y) (superfamily II helicase)
MIAKVIVDVPTNQTNRSFDYAVPAHFKEVIEQGMRVIVPFGNRTIQGFVVSIQFHSDVEKLKPIKEVLDLTPVLTEELIDLGLHLTETTLCFAISAFQAMLPAALKVKVQKDIVINEQIDQLPATLANQFSGRDAIPWKEVVDGEFDLAMIKKLIKDGLLYINYQISGKRQEKRVKVVLPVQSKEKMNEALQSLKRAKKQQDILSYFIENEFDQIPVTSLCENTNTNRASVLSLVEKGLLVEKEVEVYRDPYEHREIKATQPLKLTEQQLEVLTPIVNQIKDDLHSTFLLHGVTGSGKTEVYLQSIDRTLKNGKEAIVLVPEISLTPQMVHRFKGRFGSQVAVFHSGLSKGEKYDEWRKIQRGEVKVVVGARSAIFAPFKKLGIIIIDEEHESTYKQEDHPRYHAREVAIYRGKYHQCPVVLGSATPSLESFARAQKGVYHLLSLSERVNKNDMPHVNIVDMREELRNGNRSMFSAALMEKLKEKIEKGEQSVLLLNRRGYSTFVMCRDCGFVVECPHCDLSLTYHRKNNMMKCHYCGFEEQEPNNCPSCQSEYIRFFGTGTQKVEEEITKLIPNARVIRMDVDTTRKKGSHEKLLQQFSSLKADILLGTQMIAKGLDFPNVTLVGILAADTMLHLPDFRSAEKTFQLLTQVSGRAGRHELTGEVIVQTYTPEHYSILHASKHDFLGFYETEMNMRKQIGYPPYYYLVLINVSHMNVIQASEITERIATFLKDNLTTQSVILGPVVSPISKIKDRYRYQCMIKYKNESNLLKSLQEIVKHYNKDIHKGNLQLSIDLNPYTLM